IDDAVTNVMDFTSNANPQIPASLAVNATDGYAQRVSAFHWWLDQMATRPRPFQEKMTLFWHGHFTSEWDVVNRSDSMMHQNQLYRTQGLGNLLALTQAMALEPAMLVYLSNASNVKGTPNENFARELMELYTLGVGNYTEDDVHAAALAWTGHNVNNTSGLYEFKPTRHDISNKTFFGTAKNWDGPDIINEILRDNLPKQAIAARLITKKIWEFLAYPKPDAALLDALTAIFIAGNLEIAPLVRAILLRPEFYSPAATQGLVRTPTDWVVSLMACSGQTATAINVFSFGDRMGQTIFDPPNVSGWKSNNAWMTTSALCGRANVAMKVASLLHPGGAFEPLYGMSVTASVDFVTAYFGLTMAASSRQSLIDAHQAERAATNGNNVKAVVNLMIMTMLTGEMNVA
ncbi:MAG: hypothetical protein JWN99_2563, partial [Ilumatobacteraceae bacterium]|nr:hypothetical protein [Ilumatobacteraceae bacterium]